MRDLDALAQAARDALLAAEERGFERALGVVEAAINANPHLCVVMSAQDFTECRLAIEIKVGEDRYLCSRPAAFSDVVYEQYPDCKGSTESMRSGVAKSLAVVDHIIANWGTPAASEPPA